MAELHSSMNTCLTIFLLLVCINNVELTNTTTTKQPQEQTVDREVCKLNNISNIQCNCKDSPFLCTTSPPSRNKTESGDGVNPDLKEICEQSSIPEDQCNCVAIPDLCNIPPPPGGGGGGGGGGIDIKETCKQSGIPDDECNCVTIPDLCNIPPPPDGSGGQNGSVHLEGKTLKEVCDEFQIPRDNCSCDVPDVKVLCDLFKLSNTITVIKSRCNVESERIRASITLVGSLFGLVGNALVILVTYNNRKKSTVCHKLIGGLALSDFVFSIVQIIDISPSFRAKDPCDWIYGDGMCKFVHDALSSSSWIAVGFILIITVERYLGIVFPFSRGLSTQKIWILILTNIVFAFAVVMPVVVVSVDAHPEERCIERWPQKHSSRVYSHFTFILSYVAPVICLFYMYGKIIVTLTGSNKNTLRDDQQNGRKNENKRILIILLSILFFYLVLLFPNRLVWILVDEGVINSNTSDQAFSNWKLWSTIPYALHVAVNPIIYSFIDRKFRATIISIFNCKHFFHTIVESSDVTDTSTGSTNMISKDL